MSTACPDDLRFMDTALALAYAALGTTAPNPAVGCVIVRDGRIVGAAATDRGGRPHAETRALDAAGEAARGARIYVTLEPCAHFGKTPPCADALIAAEPDEVVIACADPFDQVAGRGAARLRAAGVRVREGVREAEAKALNAGFFTRLSCGLPMIGDDRRAGLYDMDLTIEPGEREADALARLGKLGVTRVRRA